MSARDPYALPAAALRRLAFELDHQKWPSGNDLHFALTALLVAAPADTYRHLRDVVESVPDLADACRRLNDENLPRGNHLAPVAGSIGKGDGDGA